MELAAELCDGRLVLCHEGGYSTTYVPFCGLAVLEQLSGIQTAVSDPYLAAFAAVEGQELQPHQAAAIGRWTLRTGASWSSAVEPSVRATTEPFQFSQRFDRPSRRNCTPRRSASDRR